MSEQIHWRSWLRFLPRVISTHLHGRHTDADWPLSGTFFLPLLEIAGGVKTPNKLLQVVTPLYTYVRNTDSFIDMSTTLPSLSQIEAATASDHRLFLSALGRSLGPALVDYAQTLVSQSKTLVYSSLVAKDQWGTAISFSQAYAYRYVNNVAASDLTSRIWCQSLGISGPKERSVIQAARRVAMVMQFTDDLSDRTSDPPDSGNLVQAILRDQDLSEPDLTTIGTVRHRIALELRKIRTQSAPLSDLISDFSRLQLAYYLHCHPPVA